MSQNMIRGIVLVLVAVITVAFLGAWLGSFLTGGGFVKNASAYSAVYLSNGDMYFGVLSWFPKPHLSKVWLLQRQLDQNNQPQTNVAEFSKAFWAPVDDLYLNSKQIIWWSRLRSDSALAGAMNNPSLLMQTQQQTQQPVPTDTFKGPSTQPPSKK